MDNNILLCPRFSGAYPHPKAYNIMKTVHTISELKAEVSTIREQGLSLGLVPTMGALHAGHLSLVSRSIAENNATVVSVFVNPTQFNDKNDLANYPRTLEADCSLLEQAGVTLVFAPTVEEIYPQPDTRHFSYPPLDEVMEGAYRPGHFNGVCQIVSKLFEIITPDRAYFGEKDYQQLAIIRRMVSEQGYPIDIIGCPIVREIDGLALSSRNARLSDDEHRQALQISKALFGSEIFARDSSVAQTRQAVEHAIREASGLELEYFHIVDGETLQDINDWSESTQPMGCIAVYCGPVRLIDNVHYRQHP